MMALTLEQQKIFMDAAYILQNNKAFRTTDLNDSDQNRILDIKREGDI